MERAEEEAGPTGVLRDATFADFRDLRAEGLCAGLAAFRATGLARFTFKRTDLWRAAGRLAAFLVAFGFTFDLVAIGPELIRVIAFKVKAGDFPAVSQFVFRDGDVPKFKLGRLEMPQRQATLQGETLKFRFQPLERSVQEPETF